MCWHLPSPPPLNEVLSTFEIADGFSIELFAGEPLVTDPVAMTVDPNGHMYVVELHGYPDDESGASRIKQLTDTNGDGLPDEYTIFADELRMPKGITSWKNGLLVTDAPDVLYLEDTDGDGRADVRRTLLTGFSSSNPQLGVNTPLYGLDNWIYLAHLSRSDVRFPDGPDSTINVGGNVRIRPDAHKLEVQSGQTQFGQTFNRWGDHFLVSNSNHIFQEVLAAPYLTRNPDLLVESVTENISDHGASAQVYPITPDPNNRLGKPGGITSASGIISYLGGSFPDGYRNVTFVGEPIYNVIHADRLVEQGATYTANRLRAKREFLASTDRWFRPVNFYIGPDGALYVMDYSRRIIEQPRFLTREILDSANLYAGADRGRIYRITREGAAGPSWLDNTALAQSATQELVKALRRPNIWWRRHAQRMLVDRQSDDAIEPLTEVARSAPRPASRVHALWTLKGLNALEPELIGQALADTSAGVRRHAIRLAEDYLLEGQNAGEGPTSLQQTDFRSSEQESTLVDRLLTMSDDEDAHVRFQLLLTLGYLQDEQVQDLRQEMLFANLDSKWMQLAGLSAPDVQATSLYERAVADLSGQSSAARRDLFRRISSLIGGRARADEVKQIISTAVEPPSENDTWWRTASLQGLADGLRGSDLAELSSLEEQRQMLVDAFFTTDLAGMRSGYLAVLEATGLPAGRGAERAASVAADETADTQKRADAVRLLALADVEAHRDLLAHLVDPQAPTPVQTEAVEALGQLGADNVGPMLISRWGSMTPSVRDAAIRVLLQDLDDRESMFRVFDAIEQGVIKPTVIPRHMDEDLVESNNDAIRRRANDVLRQEAGARQEVFEEYRAVLERSAETERGQQVFTRVCARCHQVGGTGGMAFGPDLSSLENRPPEWLLKAILIPNHAIADGYEQWSIERSNGETAAGVIASETPTSVTVRSVTGQDVTIARSNIESIEEVQGSAMPVGLENQITKQQMADLLSYLMSVQTVN